MIPFCGKKGRKTLTAINADNSIAQVPIFSHVLKKCNFQTVIHKGITRSNYKEALSKNQICS